MSKPSFDCGDYYGVWYTEPVLPYCVDCGVVVGTCVVDPYPCEPYVGDAFAPRENVNGACEEAEPYVPTLCGSDPSVASGGSGSRVVANDTYPLGCDMSRCVVVAYCDTLVVYYNDAFANSGWKVACD